MNWQHTQWSSLSMCLPKAHQSMALLCPAPVIISWIKYKNIEKKLVDNIIFLILLIQFEVMQLFPGKHDK